MMIPPNANVCRLLLVWLLLSATGAAADAGARPDYYLELELDKEQVYPREQLLVRIRLLSAVALEDLQGSSLTIDAARVVPLGDQQYQKTEGEIRYRVYQKDYAVFAQREGTLRIPPQRFTATRSQPRPDRGGSQEVRLTTAARQIEVRPLPTGQNQQGWLPATSVELSQQLDHQAYRVGEPITRNLTLAVDGQPAVLLPPLPAQDIKGARVYPEPARNQTDGFRDGVRGMRSQQQVLVPSRPGPLTLPAFELPWWDTVANRPSVARLPSRVIQVLPATNPSSPADPLPPPSRFNAPVSDPAPVTLPATGLSWLLWSNLAWLLLTALLLLGWRRRQRRLAAHGDSPATVSDTYGERHAYQRLVQACLDGECREIRDALLAWAFWHLPPEERQCPLSLEGVARRWPDPGLKAALAELDRALYRAEGRASVATDQLLSGVERVRDAGLSAPDRQANPLPPLYRI